MATSVWTARRCHAPAVRVRSLSRPTSQCFFFCLCLLVGKRHCKMSVCVFVCVALLKAVCRRATGCIVCACLATLDASVNGNSPHTVTMASPLYRTQHYFSLSTVSDTKRHDTLASATHAGLKSVNVFGGFPSVIKSVNIICPCIIQILYVNTGVPLVTMATLWYWAASVSHVIAMATLTPTCCSPTVTH